MGVKNKFHEESKEGFDAVLERMWEIVGKPPATSYSKGLDINENTLKTWRRRNEVPKKFLIGFAAKHGVSVDYLLRGEKDFVIPSELFDRKNPVPADAPHGFVLVPRYEVQASAGNGMVIHSEQVVDYLAFKEDWVRNTLGVTQKDLALISVKGDSMEPSLSNDDLILVDMRRNRVDDNAIYVLQLDGTLLVKRIQHKLDGSLHVMSDNPRYDAEIISAERATELRVLGRVVWSGRRM